MSIEISLLATGGAELLALGAKMFASFMPISRAGIKAYAEFLPH